MKSCRNSEENINLRCARTIAEKKGSELYVNQIIRTCIRYGYRGYD